MATFTPEELALAVEIHQLAKALNSRMRDAKGLGLYVAPKLEEADEVYEPAAPGSMQSLPGDGPGGVELKALVYKAVVVEAANPTSTEEPDAVLPHGWMG